MGDHGRELRAKVVGHHLATATFQLLQAVGDLEALESLAESAESEPYIIAGTGIGADSK